MENTLLKVPEMIIPYKWLIIIGILFSVLLGIQVIIDYELRDTSIVWEGSCSFEGWNSEGTFGFSVDCGDNRSGEITSSSVVRSYIRNPGPLGCSISRTGRITCDDRPPLQ